MVPDFGRSTRSFPAAIGSTVTSEGFSKLEHSAVDLQIADVKSVDVAMKVGSVSQGGGGECGDSADRYNSGCLWRRAQLVGLSKIATYDQLSNRAGIAGAGRVPGSLQPVGAASLWSNSSLSGIKVNGSGSGNNAVNYVLDGATDAIVSSGNIAFIPPNDAVSQVRVMTNFIRRLHRTYGRCARLTCR